MTKSSKKLTAFGIALALAILIGGFLLHPWERTKSELTVTKVDLSDNSIYATAPNQLYGTNDYYLIQGASEYLKENIQLSQIEEGENIVVVSNGKVLRSPLRKNAASFAGRAAQGVCHFADGLPWLCRLFRGGRGCSEGPRRPRALLRQKGDISDTCWHYGTKSAE